MMENSCVTESSFMKLKCDGSQNAKLKNAFLQKYKFNEMNNFLTLSNASPTFILFNLFNK